jgi:isoquinoline 1-oxidoreductase alpha subunit
MITIMVNGQVHSVDAEPETPLLWVLRDTLGLTGTKYGCGVAQCGACTVHVGGQAQRSCSLPVGRIGDAEVTTIEGVAQDRAHPVIAAWIEVGVPQCGYCQTGQVMATTALLNRDPNPSDETIDREMTNICRCGTYADIRKAIHRASTLLSER